MIHLLCGEYPPTPGGVGDYSALIARALSTSGEDVHVWAPGLAGAVRENGVTVHRIAGNFSFSGLAKLNREFGAAPAPRHIIVQWTPHAFGFRSLNLAFVGWLWMRAHLFGDRVDVMVHEPFLAFGEGSWRRDAAAVVHRLMALLLLGAASKVWVSIPAWEECLQPWALGRNKDFEWLPVPSNLTGASVRGNALASLSIRSQITSRGEFLVGHFGSFRQDVAGLLACAMIQLLQRTDVTILLTGRGSDDFCAGFVSANSWTRGRVIGTGELSPAQVAVNLSACDVLLQPFPDGISTRRGTAMAALALGVPMVTNIGHLTENLWSRSGAVALARSSSGCNLADCTLALLADPERRRLISATARETYAMRFDIDHTVTALMRRVAKEIPTGAIPARV